MPKLTKAFKLGLEDRIIAIGVTEVALSEELLFHLLTRECTTECKYCGTTWCGFQHIHLQLPIVVVIVARHDNYWRTHLAMTRDGCIYLCV